MIFMKTNRMTYAFLTLFLSAMLTSCVTEIKTYSESPEDWQLHCNPLKSRCYGTNQPDPVPPYIYTDEFPRYYGSFSLEQFDANEKGRIKHVIDSNALWITPDGGAESRLFRLARHHQSKIPGYADHKNSILVRLLDIEPILVPTERLKKRIQVSQAIALKHEAVEYKCLGMDSSGAVGCFLRVQDKYDLGEWFISKGLANPIKKLEIDKRYESAYNYARINDIGLHNVNNLERSLFPSVKKDQYGFCRELEDPHLIEAAIYTLYQNMEDCLSSGGLRPKYTSN